MQVVREVLECSWRNSWKDSRIESIERGCMEIDQYTIWRTCTSNIRKFESFKELRHESVGIMARKDKIVKIGIFRQGNWGKRTTKVGVEVDDEGYDGSGEFFGMSLSLKCWYFNFVFIW